jgi:hypothetical protein
MTIETDYIAIQSRLKRLRRNQRYLAKVFHRPESHVSLAIHGSQYQDLLAKILFHLNKLEAQQVKRIPLLKRGVKS